MRVYTGDISHFDYFVNGGNIEHGVTLDAAGNLYGTTMNGGPLDYGVVFKLTKQPDGTGPSLYSTSSRVEAVAAVSIRRDL